MWRKDGDHWRVTLDNSSIVILQSKQPTLPITLSVVTAERRGEGCQPLDRAELLISAELPMWRAVPVGGHPHWMFGNRRGREGRKRAPPLEHEYPPHNEKPAPSPTLHILFTSQFPSTKKTFICNFRDVWYLSKEKKFYSLLGFEWKYNEESSKMKIHGDWKTNTFIIE